MQQPVASQIPRGVGCPPPPGMDPRKGKGKLMCIKVRMLDDSVGVFHLGHKATGQALFEEVCRHLNLLESDYFGLEFIDSYGNRCWLDKEKSILRQIMVAQSDARFFFIVKFYTPNPVELEEEYTRYLFALQLRRDLARGELMCSNESTAALLVALMIQSECGDFSPLDYPDAGAYLAGAHFVPHQTPAFAQAVLEQHKRLIGMGPAEADFALLETARRCDFYGLRLHPARDIEGTEVALAVAHMGIKVFHQLNCVTTFSWAKVRKLSFKRKRMMIKIHPDSYQFYKETIEFSFENRDDCKNFWKKCVEHHSFFRCVEPIGGDKPSRRRGEMNKRHLFARGSHFHYQGRTQKQLIDYVREHRKRREPFERPLRRGNEFLVAGGGTNSLSHYHQSKAQFFVSDRMASEPLAQTAAVNEMGNGHYLRQQQKREEATNKNNSQFVCNFPSLCHQRQQTQPQQQNGGAQRKGRPKSAVVLTSGEKKPTRNGGAPVGGDQYQQQQQNQLMQSSYHAGITPVSTMMPSMTGTGSNVCCRRQQNGTMAESSVPPASSSALLHQHLDPMSMSLPNVLADGTAGAAICGTSSQLSAADSYFYTTHKSVSGENFHRAAELRDNQSEGSYRLGRGVGGRQRHNHQTSDAGGDVASSSASSQSDIGAGPASAVDPRVYQTTFTTRRVGNVIVKRVTPAAASDVNHSAAKPSLQHQHHRPPLTSRSAVDGADAGDGSESVASSTAACSNYSLAATAPPSASSAPTSARSTGGGVSRIRCAPHSTTIQGLPTHLRNEIPVAIDGPPPSNIVNRNGQQQQQSKTTIIRPVLIPSPAAPSSSSPLDKTGRASNTSSSASKRPSSSASSNASSTPTQSIALRRPLVVKAPDIGAKQEQQDERKDKQWNNAAGTAGPIPGRVIRCEDLVITPGGIGLKEQTQQKRKSVAEEKPKVPPKPTLGALGLPQRQKQLQESPAIKSEADASTEQLLDPLESILKDVRAMNEALDVLESPSASGTPSRAATTFQAALAAAQQFAGPAAAAQPHQQQQQQQRPQAPAAIAIESEECPEVRTLHLFNGGADGNRVPYTLTVRDLSGGGQQKGITSTDTMGDAAPQATTSGGKHSAGAGGRHKSIELVQRKRLPSQDSYSSQDHSISPTTPDTGNVLEYVLRKRSASSDRAAATKTATTAATARRGAERRLTQPVELSTLLAASGSAASPPKHQQKSPKAAYGGLGAAIAPPAPSPAPSADSPPEPQQLLETDF